MFYVFQLWIVFVFFLFIFYDDEKVFLFLVDQGGDSQKYLFVGFDDFMIVGLCGFLNVFGYFIDEFLQQLDLEFWCGGNVIIKIVYGYYMMFFIIFIEMGKCFEEVMVNNNVVVYFCGYLYIKFGCCFYKCYKYVIYFFLY